MTLEERFWQKVDKRLPDECWEWNAATCGVGYGHMRVGTKVVDSHRLSWEIHNGEIPEHNSYHGMCVLHKCDNRKCVNPDHLFLGTQMDNVRDRDSKGRQLVGEQCSWSKLTDNKVKKIRELRSRGGYTLKDIGDIYGLSFKHISDIVNRKIWKHI